MNFRYRHGDRPLDGYTIQRGVGHGGFGEVYYALSDGGREVALKSILRNQEVELRGVRHCINLKNPYLVSIFDVRTGEDGTPFVVMEYIAGPSLRDLLHASPEGLGEQKAGYLVREIARGLAYLHERGIVHRDLKPENIFFEEGYVKIGDYGLSKYISASRQSGQTISVGTVHYMAPEIGTGSYDRSIDIYALGIILYEFLTGTVPFTGDSFGEILMKHLTATPDLTGINEPFCTVIARALEKKPEDRYASMEAMTQALFCSEAITDSVAAFDPAGLSNAGRGGDPMETRPIPDPAVPLGPPVPPAPAVPPGPAPRTPHVPSQAAAAHGEVAQDPRTSGQRVRQAAVILLVIAMVLAFFGIVTESWGWFLYLVLTASGAAAVVAAESAVATSLKLGTGLRKRLVTALAAVAPGAGLLAIEPWYAIWALTPLFLGLVVIDWKDRYAPHRRNRISWTGASVAGLTGLITGLVFLNPLFIPCCLFGVSLLVNALAPHVPRAARRRAAPPEDIVEPPEPPMDGVFERLGGALENATTEFQSGLAAVVSFLGLGDGDASGSSFYRAAGQPDRPPEVPPQPATRLVWMFIAATLIAGSLSSFAVMIFGGLRGEELALALGMALGCGGYTIFAFWRGLWVRTTGVWRRTISPFLLTSAINAAVISGTVLLLSEYVDFHIPSDGGIVLGVFSASCLALAVFLVAADYLVRRMRYVSRPDLPWHSRAVHPCMRTLHMLLGTIGVTSALAIYSMALLSDEFGRDRVPMLCFATGLFGAGIYFFHMGLRRRRGTPWQGYLRPLIVATAISTVVICAIFLLSGELRRHEERSIVMIIGIFAAVFGVFAYVLQGEAQAEPDPVPNPPVQNPRVAPGWSGVGMVFWLIAVLAALAFGVVRSGIGEQFHTEMMYEYSDHDLRTIDHVLLLTCFASAVVGSACILISRLTAGFMHTARGFFGQLAIVVAMACYAFAVDHVRIVAGGHLELRYHGGEIPMALAVLAALASTVLGCILLFWPYRRKHGAQYQNRPELT